MIEVKRLNGTTFLLNALYIEKIESFHDTTITLTTGTKYVVGDTAGELQEKIHAFYGQVQLLSVPATRSGIDEE